MVRCRPALQRPYAVSRAFPAGAVSRGVPVDRLKAEPHRRENRRSKPGTTRQCSVPATMPHGPTGYRPPKMWHETPANLSATSTFSANSEFNAELPAPPTTPTNDQPSTRHRHVAQERAGKSHPTNAAFPPTTPMNAAQDPIAAPHKPSPSPSTTTPAPDPTPPDPGTIVSAPPGPAPAD